TVRSWQPPSLSWVYLVTGGCGFVGERIVELLSQQDYIKEVRVFDSVAREEVEKFTPTRVTVMRGDIRDPGALLAAMRGVHVVLHTAAVVDYRNMVSFWEMRAVNVGGTENVVRACCALSIPYLLYTSSIAAVGPNTSCEPLLRGNEDTQYTGEVELPYGKTKAMAEKIVLEANGAKVQNPVVAPLELQHRAGERGRWKNPTAPGCVSILCLDLMHKPHCPKPPKA
uniref:Uncharacterized protein n=1 Tax=Geospiza parvula TaxID=87175 RepID=A0A8U8B551_GEOPR